MGVQQDIFESFKEALVMIIDGQPTDKDINELTL